MDTNRDGLVMTKRWEMTAEELADHQARVERALAAGDEAAAALEERQRAGNWYVGATTGPRMEEAHQRAPETPVQRPASAPRDWLAESKYFAGVAGLQTDGKIAELVDGVGMAIAEIRREMRQEFEAKLISAKADLLRQFTDQIATMRDGFSAAIRADERVMSDQLARIERLLDRWSRIDVATRDMTLDSTRAH
jgi:hypothetical protein